MRVIISVYNKRGVVEFARELASAGAYVISTGGTYDLLAQTKGLPVKKVSDVTAFPEILDGRVKTLHPAIHGGILARRDTPAHAAEIKAQGIEPLDVVVSNLYPFLETISKPGIGLDEALENIDIGGPAMLRAAAKNFPWVTVVVDPEDYPWVADAIKQGGPSFEQRRLLAWKAFNHVAQYDTAVANYLQAKSVSVLPETLSFSLTKKKDLRYGENPHQPGALYTRLGIKDGLANAPVLNGKELSYNNYLDADAAWKIVGNFSEQTVVVVKHGNPCGLASGPDQAEAYARAYHGDEVSAFGGIVGFNQPVTAQTALAMKGVFYEVVVAPAYEAEALELLKKRKNLRILQVSQENLSLDYELRPISGGVLAQTPDDSQENSDEWKTVSARKPSKQEMVDLIFAWKAAKHVASNAIVLAKGKTLVGMGAGQPNRLVSVHLALRGAANRAQGSVLASDAFFPFSDNVELAAQGGITAIVQPGGSIRDEDSIEAANQNNIAMVFTGRRHFRH